MLARDPEQIQTETAVTAPKQAPRRAAIAMFGLLLASYVINAMDRQLFPLLVPEVRRQYNFSLSDVGLLSTVFTLGMASPDCRQVICSRIFHGRRSCRPELPS